MTSHPRQSRKASSPRSWAGVKNITLAIHIQCLEALGAKAEADALESPKKSTGREDGLKLRNEVSMLYSKARTTKATCNDAIEK